jgi:hypothetical protein
MAGAGVFSENKKTHSRAMSRFIASMRPPAGNVGTPRLPDSATRLYQKYCRSPGGVLVEQQKTADTHHANVLIPSNHPPRRHLAGSHRSPVPEAFPPGSLPDRPSSPTRSSQKHPLGHTVNPGLTWARIGIRQEKSGLDSGSVLKSPLKIVCLANGRRIENPIKGISCHDL